MNCDNELIVCTYTQNNPNNKITKDITKNIIFNKMFTKIIENITNNKSLTREDISFIESMPENKKMEVIKLYDKKLKTNMNWIDELMQTKSLR